MPDFINASNLRNSKIVKVATKVKFNNSRTWLRLDHLRQEIIWKHSLKRVVTEGLTFRKMLIEVLLKLLIYKALKPSL